MSAVARIDPSAEAKAAVDDMRLEAIVEFLDSAASYARSASEAAWRGNRQLLRTHLFQLKECTRIAVLTFNELERETAK